MELQITDSNFVEFGESGILASTELPGLRSGEVFDMSRDSVELRRRQRPELHSPFCRSAWVRQ